MRRGLDLSIHYMYGLQVKGLQSFCLSNFRNDSDPVGIKAALFPCGLTLAGWQTFFKTLTANNFAALWSIDLIWKDLYPSSKFFRILREWQHLKLVSFAFSKGPHFHRAYSKTVRYRRSRAVYGTKFNIFLYSNEHNNF